MKLPRRLLKWLAVASSTLLVAGFICYQAGAFDWIGRSRQAAKGENEREMFGSSKRSEIFAPKSQPPSETTSPNGALLGGSKYIVIPQLAQPPKAGKDEKKSESKAAAEKPALPER